MSARGPYEVLGMASDASDDEIKRAYRRRARDLHPDRHGHASEEDQEAAQLAMVELNVAYDTIRKHRSGQEDPSATGSPLDVAHALAARFAINAAVLRFSPAADDPGKLSRWRQRLLGELLDQLEEQYERSPADRFVDRPSDHGRNAFRLFAPVIEDFIWRATNTAKNEGQDLDDAFGLLHVTAFTLYGLAYQIGPDDPGFEQIVDRLAHDIIAAYKGRLRNEEARASREPPRQPAGRDARAGGQQPSEKAPVAWAPFWVALVAVMFVGAAWDLADGLAGHRPVDGFSWLSASGLGWLLWWQVRESHRARTWAYRTQRWLVDANESARARRVDPPARQASPPPSESEPTHPRSHAEPPPPPPRAATSPATGQDPPREPEQPDNQMWTSSHNGPTHFTARGAESPDADTGKRLLVGCILVAVIIGSVALVAMSDTSQPPTISGSTDPTATSPPSPPRTRPEPPPPQARPWVSNSDCITEDRNERDMWEAVRCGDHDGIIVETRARRHGSDPCRPDHDLWFEDEWGFYCGQIVTDSTSAGGEFGMGPVVPGVTCIVVERDTATKRPCTLGDAVTVTALAASESACANELYPSGFYYSLPTPSGQGAVCIDWVEFERVYR